MDVIHGTGARGKIVLKSLFARGKFFFCHCAIDFLAIDVIRIHFTKLHDKFTRQRMFNFLL